jgi:hypothetical protein
MPQPVPERHPAHPFVVSGLDRIPTSSYFTSNTNPTDPWRVEGLTGARAPEFGNIDGCPADHEVTAGQQFNGWLSNSRHTMSERGNMGILVVHPGSNDEDDSIVNAHICGSSPFHVQEELGVPTPRGAVCGVACFVVHACRKGLGPHLASIRAH